MASSPAAMPVDAGPAAAPVDPQLDVVTTQVRGGPSRYGMIGQVVSEGGRAVDVQQIPGRDGVVTVAVSGEIDMETAGELLGVLSQAVDAASPPGVVVDMSDVRFCDSSGLNALVAAHRAALQRGTPFRVGMVSAQVRRVLEITELFAVLTGQTIPNHSSRPHGPGAGAAES